MARNEKYFECQYYPAYSESFGIKTYGEPFRYATKAYSGFCAPNGNSEDNRDGVEKLKQAFFESTYGSKVVVWAGDIYKSWAVILVVAVISLFLGYLYLYIIRLLGGAIIWITFVLLALCLAGAGGYSFYKSGEYDPENPYYNYLKWGAYVLWALDAIVLILMCCCYNAIKLGIAIFKTTSMYV